MKKTLALLLPFALLASGAALAQGPSAGDAEQGMTAEEFEASLRYQDGVVTLKDGLATLNLPKGYRFLDPDNAYRLLVEGWGNPPQTDRPLGMIVPAGVGPLAEESWGVIITFEEDGYVKDDEAADIDYDALLKEMKSATAEESEERKAAGYEPLELVGWAARPHYDAATHKLYWAKELKFGGMGENTLNYNIRALGRRGVLVLNAVGSMGQLETIERDMQAVLGFVEFNPGHRYTDFVSGDKVAAYGIGALIAGKVVAKAGILKILLGLLVAMKKGVVVIVVAAFAFLRRFFGGGKGDAQPAG